MVEPPMMVFSTSCKEKNQGTAFFVPFRNNSLQDFDALNNEVANTAKAEKMQKPFLGRSSYGEIWAVMGFLMNPKTVKWKKTEVEKRWSKNISKKDGFDASIFRLNDENSIIGQTGLLDIKWPCALDERESAELNSYDLLIATVTRPTKYPTSMQLAKNVKDDRHRYYFISNYQYGITTFQDIQVINKL